MFVLHILLCDIYDFHHIIRSLHFVGLGYFLFLSSPHSQSSHTTSLSLTISVSLRWLQINISWCRVYEHWASCTIAELQLIHTSVASSAQTDLTNYSWLRQGTVFCLGCLDCFWVFFLLCCDTVNRAVGHSAGFGIKEVSFLRNTWFYWTVSTHYIHLKYNKLNIACLQVKNN